MVNKESSIKRAIAARQNVKERDYWLNKLAGVLEKSRFPYDHNMSRDYQRFGTLDIGFSGQLCSRLLEISNRSDPILYIILTAGLVVLLNKYTGSRDIILGTPILKPDKKGQFMNLVLPLRHRLEKNQTFNELLLGVRQTIIEANENQNYPLEMLAGQLNMNEVSPGDLDSHLFDVAILLENIHHKDYLRQLNLNVIFSFLRTGENVAGVIEFNSLKYEQETVKRISNYFSHLLKQALFFENLKISNIEIMSGEEKKQLLFDFNNTTVEYQDSKPIQQLVEEQVEKSPDQVALVFETEELTYLELNKRSNQLAHLLREKGIGRNTIVGLLMRNSLEMIIGVLAVLKAGGAYLPIYPAAPQNRISAMLQDSSAPVLLTMENSIQGVSFRSLRSFEHHDSQPHLTGPRAQVEDLDSLQIPNRSLVDYEKYRPYIGQAMVKNSITIQMSRGCVFNCAFCFKIWPRKYIIRSAENIFNEIYFYYKLGIRRFAFVDDLPNINVEVSSKVFRLIIEHGLKVHLHFPNGIRGDILTPEYIDLMVEAGTITMDLALETTSPRLQKLIGKNLNLKRLQENIKYITSKHPQVILELQIIHGIPTETEEEARASLDFIKGIKWVHFPYIHILNIYPNSDMARIAIENGISREAIERSSGLAYHELPETLPFPKSFTRKYQSEFLNEYFLAKERLLTVLPYQMKVLSEDELVQKYNSYLPMEIKSFRDLLDCAGIFPEEVAGEFLSEDYGVVPGFNQKLKANFPQKKAGEDALNLLLLDLSQYFTHDTRIMYDVVEPPLGLLYLLTHLDRTFGSKINGKIAKSRIDFDSFEQLKELIDDFQPHVIGIRTLNFYRDFFHKTISRIKQWYPAVPIIAGGPYATSHYDSVLKDSAVDLAVLGEGEFTFAEVIGKILENEKRLPGKEVLANIAGVAFAKDSGSREILLLDSLCAVLSSASVGNPAPVNISSDLAYIIYTSGSTGTPKGVMIQHNHLVNQVTGLIKRFGFDGFLNYVMLAPFTFDVSVMHIFLPLITGAKLCLICEDTREDHEELWQFISRNKIDILNVVPTFMEVLIRYMEKNKLRLHYLFVGGDVFTWKLYKALRETFEVHRTINIYGPTETTINATLYECEDVIREAAIPIGKPLFNYKVYILDEELDILPIGAWGELCISGEGLARGYLNRAQLSAGKFMPNPFTAGEQLFKSGDLARWLPDGNIEFLGRIDCQVKIRGIRIEPAEIENRLKRHEAIGEAVVVAREDGEGDKYLCAYYELIDPLSDTPKKPGITELREYLLAELPDYMIPSYFVRLDKIPITANGKVDRKALPGPEIKSVQEYVAPRNDLEQKLAQVWSEVLKVDMKKISINTNFFEIGGHSLKAAVLISKIHKKLNVRVPMIELFKRPTLKGLVDFIQDAAQDEFISIRCMEKKEYYSLSSAQKRLYIIQQVNLESKAYNMPQIVLLEGELELPRIKKAFKRLIERHESLRTSLKTMNGELIQRINNNVEFDVEYYGLASKISGQSLKAREESIIKDFIKPFDLSKAPLIRAAVIDRVEKGEYLLIVDTHHVITDGISNNLLITDFISLYKGENLPPLRLQYRDYSEWQNSEQGREVIKKQEVYWLKVFEKDLPVLNLAVDYKRPMVQSFEGSTINFEIGGDIKKKLDQIAIDKEITLYMLLLAVLNICFYKMTAQNDIIIGAPVANRRHEDLRQVLGMFVNTLAVRNYPQGEKTCIEFFKEVKEKTLGAFENQEYKFEDLVERIVINRDTSRNPIFDVMFSFEERIEMPQFDNFGQKIKPYEYKYQISKFDISLNAVDSGKKLFFNLVYCTRLFKERTIDRIITYFKRVLLSVVEECGKKISDIEIISQEEKNQLLYNFNDTKMEYPAGRTIDELFPEQVERIPNSLAVFFRNNHLTYRELNNKANLLAGLLRGKGITVNTIVGIMSDRSIEMIIGILGILKAGGAYLPLDRDYPLERIGYMLNDIGSGFLLTRGGFNQRIRNSFEIIDLNDSYLNVNISECDKNVSSFSGGNRSRDLAYVMFTSGSTGNPKGVMVEHRNILNTVNWFAKQYNIQESTHVLQLSNYTFDASLNQIFGALLSGAKLFIVEKEMITNIEEMHRYIVMNHINILYFVPALIKELLCDAPKLEDLRLVISGGDELDDFLKDKIIEKGYNLYNHYGPTETAVDALFARCSEDKVTLGKPIFNVKCYILDSNNTLAPIGVPGEIFISGDGVARGYQNDPEHSGTQFIVNPLCSSERLFKTGDLARWLSNGNIEFLGRIDDQVKIRGYRIEPGEIENQLLKYEGIKEAAILGKEDRRGEKYLCAYIVPGKEISISDLRGYLAKELPDYMIPSYFVQLEKLPLTLNGKLDKRKLPAPKVELDARAYAAPETEQEKIIADIWKEVLQLERVGKYDIFFEIGGTSLHLIRLNNELKKAFNKDIPITKMFRYTTVSSLARYLNQEKPEDDFSIDDRAGTLNRAEKDKLRILRLRKEVRTGNE